MGARGCDCPAAVVIYVHLRACVCFGLGPTASGSARRSGRTEVLMVDNDLSDESATP